MIEIKTKTVDGKSLQATFLPDKGMNLISYKKGDVEVIDQSTKNLFEERYAGLGALIGPHFYRRHPPAIPAIKDEGLFPHIARLKETGDPFSHGIARYAPWSIVTSSETKVAARLSGKDLWNGVSLAALEGQNFAMDFKAELKEEALHLELAVVSDTDSLVGIHYYYFLPKGKGSISSRVQKQFRENRLLKNIPDSFPVDSQQLLKFDLKNRADYTFYPFPKATESLIELDTGEYRLLTHYQTPSQENCWQLYHPEGCSYVCIEPMSSHDPLHPNLTASSIQITLKIQENHSGN